MHLGSTSLSSGNRAVRSNQAPSSSTSHNNQSQAYLVSRSGNWVAKERIARYAKVVEGAGISPERLRWKEISAAEGLIFAKTMREMSQQLNDLGVEKIKEENERARERISAPLKRKGLIPEE